MKTSLTILLLIFSHNTLSSSSKIIPENNAQLVRQIGQSVYVACKKAGPYSTNCQIDCGNGRRFSKASGYCYFMREGTFRLKVSTRYRNRNILHTATVIVKEDITSPMISDSQANLLNRQKSGDTTIDSRESANLSNVKMTNNEAPNSHQNLQLQENEQLTQNLRNAEDINRNTIQNEFNPTDIQSNTNAFGRDSLPPSGNFSGNDVNVVDQNANRVVLR